MTEKKDLISKTISETMPIASKIHGKMWNFVSFKESTNTASSTFFENEISIIKPQHTTNAFEKIMSLATFYWLFNNLKSNNNVLLSDSNGIQTHNLLVRERMVKWLSVCLRSKWLWVRIRCCLLNFRYGACCEQEVPWHSGRYRV